MKKLIAVLALVFAFSANAATETKTQTLDLRGSTSGSVKLQAPATGGAATFVWPAVDGSANQVLGTDGAGQLQFQNVSSYEKYTVSHTALQAAALTNDIELFSAPAFQIIERIVLKHNTAFAGTGITAYTLSVGISGDLEKYTSAFDVFQAVADGVKNVALLGDVESFAGATSIRLAATSVGANLDQSTAGSVDVYVKKGLLE